MVINLFCRGDILVFLTGQEEIESLARLITDCAQHCPPGKQWNTIINEICTGQGCLIYIWVNDCVLLKKLLIL